MEGLIRFYNKNRRAIFSIVIIVAIALFALYILNGISEKSLYNNSDLYRKSIQNKQVSKDIVSDKSLVTGQKIDSSKIIDETDIIKEFLEYCNSREVEKAYDMLSDECKRNQYSDFNKFNDYYYEEIFNGQKRIYTLENWNNNIYKINISENIIDTGDLSSGKNKQDYITVVENDGQKKLNINGYISNRELNKEEEIENVNVKIIEQNVFMDYTEFIYEVTNNSDATVLMDTLEDIDSLFIEDSKGVQHYAYTHELSIADVMVNARSKNTIKIKYYSKYNSNRNIEKIGFSKIILNYSDNIFFNNYKQLYMQI